MSITQEERLWLRLLRERYKKLRQAYLESDLETRTSVLLSFESGRPKRPGVDYRGYIKDIEPEDTQNAVRDILKSPHSALELMLIGVEEKGSFRALGRSIRISYSSMYSVKQIWEEGRVSLGNSAARVAHWLYQNIEQPED